MSPDNVDNLVVAVVELIESWPKGWADDDRLYSEFYDLVHAKLEPFITKDRNYN
jgi:hypothetical protein